MAELDKYSPSQCATALINIKTKAGKKVPAYAKDMVNGKLTEALDKRVRKELHALMQTQKINTLGGLTDVRER